VEQIRAPIEYNPFDPRRLGALGDELPDDIGCCFVGAVFQARPQVTIQT
jgi:hypothetical protein